MGTEYPPVQAVLSTSSGNRLAVVVAFALFAAVLVLMAIQAPSFYRFNNLTNVLVQSSTLGLLAIGMCFVMVGGGIDLSMPAVLAFSGILGVIVMRDTGSLALGVPAAILCGAAIGLFNGVAVSFMRMAPFVVTLATMTVVGGASVWLTGSQSVTGYPFVLEDIVLTKVGGFPLSVWLFGIATAAAAVVMNRSAYGRYVRAVGLAPKAACLARIDVGRVVCTTYVLSGAVAAVTAILLVAKLGSASANLGSDSLLLDIISACVIARVSIYGGVGNPLAVAFGAVLITLVGNCMNQLGVSYYASLVVKGAIIILFVFLDRLVRRTS